MKTDKKIKIVVSDCHLSAGRFYLGRLNPHEDFTFDDDLCDLIRYYSTGEFADTEAELVLAGDFFDFLNIPIDGEFEDAVTEPLAVQKVEACIAGHPKVMDAIRAFATLPDRTVTYLVGNHDAELQFGAVRERITKEWDPEGRPDSPCVRVVGDTDRLTYDEPVEIRHGNQLEAGNELDFENPFLRSIRGEQVLNIPWGSIYIIKVVNRLKFERPHVDKVRPIRVFFLFGLILDPWFTLRFGFLTAFYFFKTRIAQAVRGHGFRKFWNIVRSESTAFQDLEKPARTILSESPDLKTIIMGHTHMPMDQIYPDGKQYINTGTWTRMINLDWRTLGQQFRKTYALVTVENGQTKCELRHWIGKQEPHQPFNG